MVARATVSSLLSRVRYDSGCWLWTGGRDADGYGRTSYHGKQWSVHRLVKELVGGDPPPPGMEIDHLCRNRACCNPIHLEWVSRSENCRRSAAKDASWQSKKTSCPAGHPYSRENCWTGVNRRGGPERHCRTCDRLRKGVNEMAGNLYEELLDAVMYERKRQVEREAALAAVDRISTRIEMSGSARFDSESDALLATIRAALGGA